MSALFWVGSHPKPAKCICLHFGDTDQGGGRYLRNGLMEKGSLQESLLTNSANWTNVRKGRKAVLKAGVTAI